MATKITSMKSPEGETGKARVIEITPKRKAIRKDNGTFLQTTQRNSPCDGVDVSQYEPLDNEENKNKLLKHITTIYNKNYLKQHPDKKQEQMHRIHQHNKQNPHIKELHRKADLARKNIKSHQQFILA
jgi:hypothetical protein